MNVQFKKGVLELMVLEAVRARDMYGYELVEEISEPSTSRRAPSTRCSSV